MAQIRNSLSMKLKGRAGAYTFYSSKGRQIARVSQNSTNYGESARRSLAQQSRRVKWSNLVNFYKLTSGILHGAFETKRANETDYNAFMRKNLPIATVALTKDMAASSMCAPQKFLLSEGSLHAPDYGRVGSASSSVFRLGLVAGSNVNYDEQPIKVLSNALVSNNSFLKCGMQISIVTVTCTFTGPEVRSNIQAFEITLDPSDNRELDEVYPELLLRSDDDGNLTFANLSEDAYAAVILSDSSSGKLHVSTARLEAGDSEAETTLSADAAVTAAISSYGLDADRFLDSGDFEG